MAVAGGRGVRVAVGVDVGVGVCVLVGVTVGVSVGMGVFVGVAVCVGVQVGGNVGPAGTSVRVGVADAPRGGGKGFSGILGLMKMVR